MVDGGLWTQIDGVWYQATGAYLKRASGWVKVQEAYVKRSGAWVRAYEYDRTPPDAPTLSVDLVAKHFKISVRLPSTHHDTDLAEIRVLYGGQTDFPATPASSGYDRRSDSTFPDEPWSSYYYNGYKIPVRKCHPDSSVEVVKQFPRNATADDKVATGKHYFAAWALDFNGNWSEASTTMFTVPTDYDATEVARSGRFSANNSGTWQGDSTFTQGRLIQGREPVRRGAWYHGSKFTDTIGEYGTAKVKSAKIYAYRDPNDTGEAEACIYAYWHEDGTLGSSAPTRRNTALVGRLAKGVGKWFDLPDTHLTALEAGTVHGFGLANQDPTKAAASDKDFSTIIGTTEEGTSDITAANNQSGEVYVIWVEKP